MVDFAGWSMPVQYASIVAEHQATRRAAGLFDISHMGRLRFDGPGAAAFLDRVVSRRVTDMKPGRVRYGLVTNDAGGILDDILTYHLSDAAGGSYYLLVVNAGNRAKIASWLSDRLAAAPDTWFTDVSSDWGMIAVQGPRALALSQPFVEGVELSAMKYYTAVEARVAGHGGIVSRTGYTGEDGVELIVGANALPQIWEAILAAGADSGVMAAGLGSRNTLRLEAGMPLYGHELDESIDPYQAGLGFAVDLEERTFPGRDALVERKRTGPGSVRVGLAIEGKRAPREGYDVFSSGRAIGKITSGTFSPTLDSTIAMAYVEAAHSMVGANLAVDIRGKESAARVVPLPFCRRP